MSKYISFQGVNLKGKPVQIIVQLQEDFKPRENIAIALQQIAQKAAHTTDLSQVNVSVKQTDQTLQFEVAGQNHKIYLDHFDKKQAILDATAGKIVPIATAPAICLESILDRFTPPPSKPRTLLEKIALVLAAFFELIRIAYQYISQLWGGITHYEKMLRWDIALLSEICKTPAPGPITLSQALQYMTRLLENEKGGVADPLLQTRLMKALSFAEKIDHLRESFNDSKRQDLVNEIQKSIEGVGQEKILLPVGFSEKKKQVEMLLEISLATDGTYTAALISASKETREYFDQQMGITSRQSARREITHIAKKDFLGTIPLFVELQIAPPQKKKKLLNVFVEALKFNGSTVSAMLPTEKFVKDQSLGHFGEIISYVSKERKNPDESKRFEIALQIRIFLDICKTNSNEFKDPTFWLLARTTALQLTQLIEKDQHLLGSKDTQAIELMRIYSELNAILNRIESKLPEFEPLNFVSHFSGQLSAKGELPAPHLTPMRRMPTAYPDIDPQLDTLSPAQPLQSMKRWANRLNQLIQLKEIDRAGHEAKLIVHMLPKPTDVFWWSHLTQEEAQEGLQSLETIAHAIVRPFDNQDATLQDIASLAALNYYALPFTQILNVRENFDLATKVMTELFDTHLSFFERDWLRSIHRSFSPIQAGATYELRKALAIAVSRRKDGRYEIPLALRAPDYAATLLKETNNAALVEYCPLGCGQDDHFVLANDRYGGDGHNYPTVFLLTQHEAFDPKALMKEGPLFRDEATDLFYLQQTNQEPKTFRESVGDDPLLSTHFDENDHRIQLMNACALYLDHPHFFKNPALRYQFETKLFNYESFNSLLSKKSFSLNQPFLMGIMNRLTREIQVSRASNDLGITGYLIFIASEITDLIQASSLNDEQEKALALSFDADPLLFKSAQDLIDQNDDRSQEHQKMFFPLLASRYFKKFCQDSRDPCFENPDVLEVIISMVGRLESLSSPKNKIDPEIKDQYRSLLYWIAPQIRTCIKKNKNWINRVLFHLHPRVAQLSWTQDFPSMKAQDAQGNHYQFDILTGRMTFGEMRIDPLPDHLQWNPDVRHIFGDAIHQDWHMQEAVSEPGTIAYLNDDFPDCRILLRKQEDIPGSFQRKSKMVIEKKNGNEWMTYIRFKAQDCVNAGEPLLEESDLPLPIALIISHCDCWMNRSATKIWAFEEGQDHPHAILSLDPKYQILSHVQFPQEGTYLLNPEPAKLMRFANIEDPAFIQVKGTYFSASVVEYFRYQIADNGASLIYDLTSKGVVARPFPGYQLQPFGLRPGKNDPAIGVDPLPRSFDGFHLLMKGGKQKVLIPLRPIQPKPTFAEDPLSQSSFSESNDTKSCPIFEYTPDPETNRLRAKTGEAYAYLAYICLAHWDYDSTTHYLNQARTSTGYGENYQKICTWIQELNTPTPNGIAVQLRFGLFQESLQNPEADPTRLQRLIQLADFYQQYKNHDRILAQTGRDPSLDLSAEEENLITKLVHELLQKWGQKAIAQPPINRALSAPKQEYKNEDREDFLGIKTSAKLIWQFLGIKKDRILDPQWSLSHFSELFNRILDLDISSVEFHQIERQIQMPCHHPLIQMYLLKLISAKKTKALGNIAKLPTLNDFWLQASRMQAVEKAEKATPQLDAINNQADAEAAANILMNSNQWSIHYLGTRIRKFLSDPNHYRNFQLEDFKNFLREEIYGTAGAASLVQLSQRLKLLDPIQLTDPIQTMDPLPPAKPAEIVQEKFKNLIPVKAPLLILVPPPPLAAVLQKVTTDPKHILSILDEKNRSYFTEEKKDGKRVDESFFDQITDPILKRLAEENRRDLRAYIEEHKIVKISPQKAKELQKTLMAQKTELAAKRDQLKHDLLQDVERFSTPVGILAIRRLVGRGVKPTLDMLISLWRRNELVKINELGLKQLSPAILNVVDQKISHYLELSTQERHLDRVLDQMNVYLASHEDSLLAEGIYEAICVQRHFGLQDPDARDLLFLEYVQEIILRKQQVAIVREMLSDPDAVRQLRMGDGKSKVLLPLLAQRKATGHNLVMLMLPEELYETNCHDLDATNRHLFGQAMLRFDFSRRSNRTELAIEEIYAQLLKTIKDQGFVMTTKSSLLSFRNAYLELLTKLPSAINSAPILGQIRAMSKIIQLFSKQTDVIADEIDACLDVRKEVNYSLHNSEPMTAIKTTIGFDLIQRILEAKANDPLHELSLNLQNNTQAAFSPSTRENLLRELAIAYTKKHPIPSISPEEFANYTANKNTASMIEEKILAFKNTDPALFQQLATVKAFINRGFNTTLGRVGNVNYGRDPVSNTWTIPYKASNTPHVGSEFDDDIEKITFCIQDYLQNGVNITQTQQITSQLRARALTELRQADPKRFLTIADTEAGQEFKAFMTSVDPEHKLGNISLNRMDSSLNIQALVEIINQRPESRLAFCHTQVIQKMRLFPAQIHSVATDVADMVNHFGGFTGTPWNLHTYHDKIHAEKNLGVDGSTWAIMLERNIPVKTFAFDAAHPIDSLVQQLGNAQALIDTGAYLRGTHNIDFIDRCLQDEKIKAGVYFDETGRIVKKIDDQVLPLELAPPTELMSQMTLYDQAHTVGADIQQDRNAVAIVTVGENTFIRDLFQAVWRMRQFHRGQKVILAVSEKIKERILAGATRPLTQQDILRFCLMNEAIRETEDNFRAEQEKIQGSAKRSAIHHLAHLIQQGADDSTILRFARIAKAQKLFVKTRLSVDEANDQYASLTKQEKPSILLSYAQKCEKTQCDQLAAAFHEDVNTAALFQSLAQQVQSRPLIRSDWCPSLVNSTHDEGSEVELEAQAEQVKEMMAEAEVEQEMELVAESLVPQVPNGEGGHGAVSPMKEADIRNCIEIDATDPSHLSQLSDSLDFFDKRIFVSTMLEKNLSSRERRGISPQSAFYSNRKPVKHVIIAKHQGCWTTIIPSTHEAHAPCRAYFKNPKSPNPAAPSLLAFYLSRLSESILGSQTEAIQLSLSASQPLVIHKLGPDRTDQIPFVGADRDQFYRLYIQVKLFNGEIEYTEEEKEALKKWLIEKGPKKFKEYFETNILPAKPRRFTSAYPNSSLAKIFAELCAQK